MPVSRLVALLAVLVLLAPTVLAQSPAIPKGSKDDFQGAKKIYVDTQGNDALRDLIVIQLLRQLPELTIVDRIEKDTLVVQFKTQAASARSDTSPRTARVTTENNGRDSLPRGGDPKAGEASVWQASTAGNDARRPGPQMPQLGTVTVETAGSVVAHPLSVPSAFGRVLKRTENDSFVSVMDFWRTLRRTDDVETATKDFVGKLAREYRKANGTK